MYNSTDQVYHETLAIKLGEAHLPAAENDVTVSISKHFQVNVLNFHCYKVETTHNFKQQHVVIVVETMSEKAIFEKKSDYPWLHTILTGYLKHPDRDHRSFTKREVFTWNETGIPELIIGCSSLEEIELRKVYQNYSTHLVSLSDQFEEIWHVSVNDQFHTFFYLSDALMYACMQNGKQEMIRQEILRILRQGDRLGYMGLHWLQFIQFDSKERFDTQFGGNWYYYYK